MGSDTPKLLDADEWFDYFDMDKNGSIDRKEFRTNVLKFFDTKKIPDFMILSMFKEHDTDQNGVLDREEFETLHRDMITQMQDENKMKFYEDMYDRLGNQGKLADDAFQ